MYAVSCAGRYIAAILNNLVASLFIIIDSHCCWWVEHEL